VTTIRTILCPVDFSSATARQVLVAADLSRLHGARLVLHHNISSLALGAGVGWMWSGDQPPLSREAVGQRLEALAGANAAGVEVELRITEGPSSSAVLAVSEAVDADLVVLSTHHLQSEDHTSVTATVLERTHRLVLALHDIRHEAKALHFDAGSGEPQVMLVPTDLTPESRPAVEFAFQLAATLPFELHLLHLISHGAGGRRHENAFAEARHALEALVPPDFKSRTHVHVRENTASHGIVQVATELGAACIVMGEHTRVPLRRWFSSDTSSGVLHDAPCPVLYVPGAHAA
jgi:nucleotide-binding universal stress UspA family protein